jgi:hypothetical protein
MLVALALLFAATAVNGQMLTDTERHTLLTSLNQTDEQLAKLAESLTPEQWNYKPAEDRWSVAEVAEHLLLSEGLLKGMINGPLMESPKTDEAADIPYSDMQAAMLDRSQKFQAPEVAQPKGNWPTQEEFVAAWREERGATIEWVKTTDADLHGHMLENPAFGMIDGEKWIGFLASHCERHMLQIEEVMADPGFPGASD